MSKKIFFIWILTFILLTSIASADYVSNFTSWENSLEGWTQSAIDNFDWTIKTGTTPSSGTGPTSAQCGSYYIYTEASGRSNGHYAILYSQNFSNVKNISFSNHDYGSAGSGYHSINITNSTGSYEIWGDTAHSTQQWYDRSFDDLYLTYGNGSVYFSIYGQVNGNADGADFAFDCFNITYFELTGGSPTVNTTGVAVINLTFDDNITDDGTGRVWTTQGSVSYVNDSDVCLWYGCANMTATSGDYLNSTINWSIGNASSLSFWIKPTSAPSGASSQAYYEFGTWNGGDYQYAEEGDYGLNTDWDFSNASIDITLGSSYASDVNVWNHYCQIYDAERLLTYKNGILLDNRSADYGNINSTQGDLVNIGRGIFGIDLIGYMDEFVLVNGTGFDCQAEYELKRLGTPPTLDISVVQWINSTLDYKYNWTDTFNGLNMSGTIPFVVNITNQGLSDSNYFNTSLYIEEEVVCSWYVNLTAGETKSLPCSIAKEDKIYKGNITIDVANNLTEDDENNNGESVYLSFKSHPFVYHNLTYFQDTIIPYCYNSSNSVAYATCDWYDSFVSDNFNPSWTANDVDPRGKKGYENAINCLLNNYTSSTACTYARNHLEGWLVNVTDWSTSDVQSVHEIHWVASTYDIMFPNLTRSEAILYAEGLSNIGSVLFDKSNVRPDLDSDSIFAGDNGKGFGSGMAYPVITSLGDDVSNPSGNYYPSDSYTASNMVDAWDLRIRKHLTTEWCAEGILYCNYAKYHLIDYLAFDKRQNLTGISTTLEDELIGIAVNYILFFEDNTYNGATIRGDQSNTMRYYTFGDTHSYDDIGEDGVVGAGLFSGLASSISNSSVREALAYYRRLAYSQGETRSIADLWYDIEISSISNATEQELVNSFGFYSVNYWGFEIFRNSFGFSNDTMIIVNSGADSGYGHPEAEFDTTFYVLGEPFLDQVQVNYEDTTRSENWKNTFIMSDSPSTTGYTTTPYSPPLQQSYGGVTSYDPTYSSYLTGTPNDDSIPDGINKGVNYSFGLANADLFMVHTYSNYTLANESPSMDLLVIDNVALQYWSAQRSTNGFMGNNWINIYEEFTPTISGTDLVFNRDGTSKYYNISVVYSQDNLSLYGGNSSVKASKQKTGSANLNVYYGRYVHYVNSSSQYNVIFAHKWYEGSDNTSVEQISSSGDYGALIDGSKYAYFDSNGDGVITARNFTAYAEALVIDVNGTGTYMVLGATNVSEEGESLFTGVATSFYSTYNASVFNDTSNPTWDELPVNFSVYDNASVLIDYNASDNVAVDTYYLNDTSVFNINSSGHFYNITSLTVGTYPVLISVNDTNGNVNSTAITVTVLNSTIPNATYTVSFTSYDLYNDSLSGVSYSSNDYFVLLFADSINSTAFTTLGLTVTTVNSTLFKLTTSGTYDVQRAKIMSVLFKGSDGSDARIKSDYITGLYKIASSDYRDSGKKGYYAKAVVTYTNGRSTNTPANAIVNFTFSDTSDNLDNSFWRELYLVNSAPVSLTTTSKLIISSSEVGSISRTSQSAGSTNNSNFNTAVPEYDNPSYSTRIEVYGGEDSDGDYSGGYAEAVFLSSGTVSFTESSTGGFVSTNYSVYDMPVFEYAFNVTGGSAEFYIGNYTVLASKSGYYSLTKSFEVTSNSNVNVTGFYNNLANVTLEIAVYGGSPSTNVTAVINNTDYTYSTSSVDGTFLIPTVQDNYSITFSGSQYATISYNLSTTGGNYTNHTYLMYSLNSINITIYNGTTSDLLDQLVTVTTVSNLSSFSNTTTTGSLFIDLLEPNDYELRFVSSGYNPQSVFLTVTNQSTQSVSVYMTSNATSEILRVRVTNLQGGEVEGAIVKLQKEVTDGDSLYYTVDEKETNTEGYTAFYVTKSLTDYYRFIVSYEGEVKLTTVETFFVPNVDEVITLAIDTSGATGVNIDNLGVSTSLSKSGANNNTYTFTWADADNEITGARMIITVQDLNYTQFSPATLYDSGVTTGFTGTLNYTLPFVNDTKYVVKTYIVYRSYSQPYNSVPVIFGETVTPDRNTGLLLASVVFVIVVLLALTLGPLASGVLGLIALGGLSLMGLVSIDISIITSLIAFLFIVFIKVKGDGNA